MFSLAERRTWGLDAARRGRGRCTTPGTTRAVTERVDRARSTRAVAVAAAEMRCVGVLWRDGDLQVSLQLFYT